MVNEVCFLRQEHVGTAKCIAPIICSEPKPKRALSAAAATQQDRTPKSLQPDQADLQADWPISKLVKAALTEATEVSESQVIEIYSMSCTQ